MAGRERIVVVFDAVGDPAAFVQMAVSLAQGLDAEVLGVFLEEAEAMAMAELPFTSVVDAGGQLQPLGKETLEAAWRAAAGKARERLNRAADQARLPWAFEVTRGRLAAAMEKAQGARATLVAGHRAASRGVAAPVVAAADLPRADALARRAASLLRTEPVLCVLDTSEADPVRRAIQHCEQRHAPLLVVSSADPLWAGAALDDLRKRASLPILVLDE
ncbi:MAG: hypothetical protein R3B13_08570 [Polyangiaceae bacterium]